MNWRGSSSPLPQTSRSASLGSGVHYTSSLWRSKARYGTSHDRGVARARLRRRRRRGVYCRAYRVNSGREPRTLRTYVEPSRPEPRRSTSAYDDKRNRQTPGGQVRRVTRPSAIGARAPPSHQRAYVSRIFIPAAAAAADDDDDVRTKSSPSYNLYNSKQRSVKYCNAVKDTSKDEHLLAFVRIGFDSVG